MPPIPSGCYREQRKARRRIPPHRSKAAPHDKPRDAVGSHPLVFPFNNRDFWQQLD
jgi:hypothetical protein